MRVEREQFLKELECTTPGLSARDVLEQSACFVFRDSRVYTYNEEVTCSQPTCAKFDGVVRAAKLLECLRRQTASHLDIELEEKKLVITNKRERMWIPVARKVRLPIDTVPKPEKWKALDPGFGEALQIVQECAAKDANFFVLTCIHITPDFIEAFDRLRACRFMIPTKIKKDLLVRRDAIKHIIPLGMTAFGLSDTWIHFRNKDGLVISCRRWTDKFPDSKSRFEVAGKKLSLPKSLIKAAERASVFSEDSIEGNRVEVTIKHRTVSLTGHSASGGFKHTEDFKYKGPDIQFTITPTILIDQLTKHNDFYLSDRKMLADGGRYTFAAATGTPAPEKSKGKTKEE